MRMATIFLMCAQCRAGWVPKNPRYLADAAHAYARFAVVGNIATLGSGALGLAHSATIHITLVSILGCVGAGGGLQVVSLGLKQPKGSCMEYLVGR